MDSMSESPSRRGSTDVHSTALRREREVQRDLLSSVSFEVAKLVIVHPHIASFGDALFGGTPGQTYRHI